jgi:hypothetical protein
MPDQIVDTSQSQTLFDKLNASTVALEETAEQAPEVVEEEKPEEVTETQEASAKGEETEAAKDDSDDTEETTEETPYLPEIDAEFLASVKKFGVSVDPTDVPEAARPAFIQKLKHMESAFTKAVMEQREYRKEKANFDADKQRLEKEFDKVVADRLTKDPTLVDKINEEIEKRKHPAYAEAVELRRDADRLKAERAAFEAQQQDAAREARGEALTNYTIGAAKQAGIPFNLVEKAVAYGVLTAGQEGREFTEADIDAIVADHAKVYTQHIAAVKGAKTKEYVKQKVADRDEAKRRGLMKGGNGSTANPPKVDMSKLSLQEKINATLDSYAAA